MSYRENKNELNFQSDDQRFVKKAATEGSSGLMEELGVLQMAVLLMAM